MFAPTVPNLARFATPHAHGAGHGAGHGGAEHGHDDQPHGLSDEELEKLMTVESEEVHEEGPAEEVEDDAADQHAGGEQDADEAHEGAHGTPHGGAHAAHGGAHHVARATIARKPKIKDIAWKYTTNTTQPGWTRANKKGTFRQTITTKTNLRIGVPKPKVKVPIIGGHIPVPLPYPTGFNMSVSMTGQYKWNQRKGWTSVDLQSLHRGSNIDNDAKLFVEITFGDKSRSFENRKSKGGRTLDKGAVQARSDFTVKLGIPKIGLNYTWNRFQFTLLRYSGPRRGGVRVNKG